MSKGTRKIPWQVEWPGYQQDLDIKSAHKLMFGKSTTEVQELFGGVRSIERADELLFMPRGAFQYYVFAFAEFLQTDAATGDSDSASPFLRLLINREERDPGSVSKIYDEMAPAVEYVASHQTQFEADENIWSCPLLWLVLDSCVCHVRRDGSRASVVPDPSGYSCRGTSELYPLFSDCAIHNMDSISPEKLQRRRSLSMAWSNEQSRF